MSFFRPYHIQEDGTSLNGINFIVVQPSMNGGPGKLMVFFIKDPDPDWVNDPDFTSNCTLIAFRDTPSPIHLAVTHTFYDSDMKVIFVEFPWPEIVTTYTFTITHHDIDPYCGEMAVDLSQFCVKDIDCAAVQTSCPPDGPPEFALNYGARDFVDLRQAFLDFAALRYPDWQGRNLVPDLAHMLLEVMAALGDEFFYYQDRIAREGYLETATQRRSQHHLARLVDYQVHEGRGADVWLAVQAATDGDLPVGTDFWALGLDGQTVPFEVGYGLREPCIGDFPLWVVLNELQPYLWSADDLCLSAGQTWLWVDGSGIVAAVGGSDVQAWIEAVEELFAPTPGQPGKRIALIVDDTVAGMPVRRWELLVREVEVVQDFLALPQPKLVIRLSWYPQDAPPFDLPLFHPDENGDLQTVLKVFGNMVPLTAGGGVEAGFVIDTQELILPGHTASQPHIASPSVARLDARGGATWRFTLPDPDERGLVWLGPEPDRFTPEIELAEYQVEDDELSFVRPWRWKRSLLSFPAAEPTDAVFTLEPGSWEVVRHFHLFGQMLVFRDYARSGGLTIRFGDDEFGMRPTHGAIFEVKYRLGNGTRSNVAADTIVNYDPNAHLDPEDNTSPLLSSLVSSVVNPLAARHGQDPESPEVVRQRAPEQFRALPLRAVRPSDFVEAFRRLEFLQATNVRQRWTGSWLQTTIAADPRWSYTLNSEQHETATLLATRIRQAGRPATLVEPEYIDLDLEIALCLAPSANGTQVRRLLDRALFANGPTIEELGFFHPDRFSFGSDLFRSALEAVLQGVPGVSHVEYLRYRWRGRFPWRQFQAMSITVGDNQVLRIDQNPRFPERGKVTYRLRGGA